MGQLLKGLEVAGTHVEHDQVKILRGVMLRQGQRDCRAGRRSAKPRDPGQHEVSTGHIPTTRDLALAVRVVGDREVDLLSNDLARRWEGRASLNWPCLKAC